MVKCGEGCCVLYNYVVVVVVVVTVVVALFVPSSG